jgi:tetratricopeptide (TPR) repeat protein
VFARVKSWLRGRRPRHRGKLALVVVALLVAAGLLGVQAWAYGQFRAAERALEKNHFAEAAEHLRRCRSVWWYREAVWLQSARAARRMEDFPEAERFLRKLEQMQGGRPSDEVHLEWSLLRAQQGETDQVVPYLRSLVEDDHPRATLILEAVARGFLRKQRFHDAAFLVRLWLERNPDDTVALFCRGFIREQLIGGSRDQAVDDYRRVLELDPQNVDVHRELGRFYLEAGDRAKAAFHLGRAGDPVPAPKPTSDAR